MADHAARKDNVDLMSDLPDDQLEDVQKTLADSK